MESAKLYSAGECPVCASAGALVLLVAIADASSLYLCPMCGCAWRTPPPARRVDEIRSLDDVSPSGARLPTSAEVAAMRGTALVELPLDEWAEDLVAFDVGLT